MAKEAQLLPPELALRALGEELQVAKDLEHLGNVLHRICFKTCGFVPMLKYYSDTNEWSKD